jgi:hypothetical protein
LQKIKLKDEYYFSNMAVVYPLIGMIMLSLTYFGKAFGMSSNLRSLCSMAGLNA